MLQRTVHLSAITAITPLLSVAILISAAHFNVAQAQKGRACGQELQKHCAGVPVSGDNVLACLRKNQDKLSKRCVGFANYIVRSCDRDAAQICPGVVAGLDNILGCLTTARLLVSGGCNAALDAAYLR